MKYIDHGTGGPASVLRIAEGEKPVLKTGEVLIEVRYAGVNRPDVMQRSGKYPPPPGASLVIGLEVAGKIVEVAPVAREPVHAEQHRLVRASPLGVADAVQPARAGTGHLTQSRNAHLDPL